MERCVYSICRINPLAAAKGKKNVLWPQVWCNLSLPVSQNALEVQKSVKEKKTLWNLLLICFSKVIMSLKAFIKAVRQLLSLRSNNYAIGIMCLFPDTWFASGSVSLRSLHFTAIFMISVCTECWNVSNLVLQRCQIRSFPLRSQVGWATQVSPFSQCEQV